MPSTWWRRWARTVVAGEGCRGDEPSPHVDWSAGSVEPSTRPRPWPAKKNADSCEGGGCLSFGISGTNAHVIAEAGPVSASLEAVPACAGGGVGGVGEVGGCVGGAGRAAGRACAGASRG